jgi:uncharacterized tellurite resistance protein B-like protein
MLRTLLARLAAGDDSRMPPDDERLALAALMVRAARADGEFETTERGAILDALAARHGLDGPAAEALLTEAEEAEAQAPDTVRFTRLIKKAVPYEERAGVIEALWRVALADGRRDAREDALLRQLAPLLGVSDQDSARARQRATEG